MVLSEVFSSEEVSNYKKTLIKERGLTARERIKGISLSKGYGLGQALASPPPSGCQQNFCRRQRKELQRLETAHRQMNADLDEKLNATKLGIGEHVDILDAYRMFAKTKAGIKKLPTMLIRA